MKIVTDSAADLPANELAELDIALVPLYIQFPEGEFSSADLTPDQFYTRLKAMHPAIPTTAQPSPGDFSAIYSKIAEADPDILSVHISSGLSGSVNAARVGSDDLRNRAKVTIWDTMTLSGGERFQVSAAARAARSGWTLERIQERLGELRKHTEVVFTLDTLEYLAKGGRIGRVQALAGTLLHLKPIISVDHQDGKYNNTGRTRSLPKALHTIAEHLHHVYGDTPVWATVMHGQVAENAAELAREIKSRLKVARLETLRVSPVLGVHTGPGVVGAAIVPMSLMADLE